VIHLSEDNRTVSRNFRVPINTDNKVLEFGKEFETESISESYMTLIEIGLKAVQTKKEIDKKPELKEQIRKQCDEHIEVLTQVAGFKDSMSNVPQETLETIIMAAHAEYMKRKMEKKLMDAQIQAHQLGKGRYS